MNSFVVLIIQPEIYAHILCFLRVKTFLFSRVGPMKFSVNVLFIRRELSGGRRLSNGIKDKLSPHRGGKSLRRMQDNRADELERRLKRNLLLHKTCPPGDAELW